MSTPKKLSLDREETSKKNTIITIQKQCTLLVLH